MKKIIIAPDSFKGTLSSIDICNIVNEEIITQLSHSKNRLKALKIQRFS